MSFVQIMQFQSSKIEDIRTAVSEWEQATEGKRTLGRSYLCEDREHPDHYSVVVLFGSYEDAMKNSALPETDALASKVTSLSDGPLTFLNLNVIEERS